MCFGNEAQTKQVDSTTSGPSWLTSAAQSNLTNAQNLQTQGFTPYSGQQVATFNPQQTASFGQATDLASSVNGGPIGAGVTNYADAPAQSVNPETIASQMSPYMSAYVAQSLQPQLEAEGQQFAGQNKAFDAGATGAGAYGDTSYALGKTNLTNEQDIANAGLVGNAYNTAFNTAIGAGAQDVSNNLTGQTTNANLAETALGRQLTGATTASGLQTNAANLTNTMGAQQTAQDQAGLTAQYNQWLMAQQYPFLTSQNLNSTIAAATPGAGQTGQQTTYAPDNSGYGMISSLAGGFLGAADGGAVPGGKPVLVGERGPEVIVPGTNSVVIPHEVLQAARDKREKKHGKPKTNHSFGIAA